VIMGDQEPGREAGVRKKARREGALKRSARHVRAMCTAAQPRERASHMEVLESERVWGYMALQAVAGGG